MPKRKVLVLDQEESPWPGQIEEFFSDTPTEMVFVPHASETSLHFNRQPPDIVFFKDYLVSSALAQKVKAIRETHSAFRIFELKTAKPQISGLVYDGHFDDSIDFSRFASQLVSKLPFPERLLLLIVDDQPPITSALRDYLLTLAQPRFEVLYALNGLEALKFLETRRPDVMLMDVKMPEMNGIELYRTLKKNHSDIPVIVHFDAIFGDEVIEIHKIGNPAIVEKGSRESDTAYLTAMIKKIAYFG